MSVFLKAVIIFLAFLPMAWSQMMPQQMGGMMPSSMMGNNMMTPQQQMQQQMLMQQYMQMNGAAMNQPFNCVGRAVQNFGQSLGQAYEVHNQRANLLMQNAANRFEHLKTCRQELLGAWREMEAAKLAHKQNTNRLESKVRQAELEYKMKVIEMERSCRQSANEEWLEYSRSIKGGEVVEAPMVAGINQRINNQRRNFFETCYRDPSNVKMIGLLSESYQQAILEIKTDIKDSSDALQNMDLQARAVQRNSLQNCEDQDKLDSFNEAQSEQMASRAMMMTRIQSALGVVQSVMSCGDSGRMPGNNRDTTGDEPFVGV